MNNLNTGSGFRLNAQLLSLCLILFGFIIIGSVVFSQSLAFMMGVSIEQIGTLLAQLEYSPDNHLKLCLAQLFTALTSFVILPFLYLKYFQKHLLQELLERCSTIPSSVTFVLLISLFSLPVVGFLAELNKTIIPYLGINDGWLQWIERSELQAKKLTELLVYFNSPIDFLLVLLVIAVLPAIGEELLFRGMLQRQFQEIFRNPHWAIVFAAFLFSFIHFQFLGFIPRMALGVLFGYVYYWTSNLWMPILMHFINNATTFLVVNWQKNHGIPDPLEEEISPNFYWIIISVLVMFFLINQLKKRSSSLR